MAPHATRPASPDVATALRVRRAIAAGAVTLACGSSILGLLHDSSAAAAPTQPAPSAPTSRQATSAPTSQPTDSHTGAAPTPTPSGGSASSTPRPSGSVPAAAAPTSAAGTKTKAVPDHGDGTMHPITVPGADSTTAGRQVTYALAIEGGMGADARAVAATIGRVLRDKRGWQTVDRVRFVQVTPQQRAQGKAPDITIAVVSPAKVDQLCAPLDTGGVWSCANKQHAVLNYRRWVEATPSYAGQSVEAYRSYQINHEVGHELGHSHARCAGAGRPAPVMLQQSMGLDGCVTNSWPLTTRG